MTDDPSSLLPAALRAADMAADLMRTRRPAQLTEKHDRDLVSDVDLAIERQIRTYLHDTTPGIGFLGEEEGQSGDSGAGWMWTIDPIDGTSNFAHGIPLCAMSLALLRDGVPVLAVIDAPFLGQRYHAIQGCGAYRDDRQLSASTTRRLKDAVVAVGDYATGPGADTKNEQRLAVTVQLAPRVHRLRMIGTAALDLAWVAEGRLDATITLGNNPWDMAAGVLIAREAGAQVMDADGSQHTINSASTIAAPPTLIDQLILLVAGVAANNTATSTIAGAAPYARLDAILSSARNLIFDFDGPICDFTGALPPNAIQQLRSIAIPDTGDPLLTDESDDPYEFVSRVTADTSDSARLTAELRRIELAAVADAVPASYVHEAISACRDSARTPAVISRQSTETVTAWLTRFSLTDQIQHIAANDRQRGARERQLEDALRLLRSHARECAVISKTASVIETAHALGFPTIGYASTTEEGQRLTASGADSVLLSLADLTLRLRARPLP